ncbi:MAG: hypothetical protein AMJ79_07280 [Phycisphaerae bacterium SM23_30]|nr:MAG: hypothetical protein AMJ79_07280 [Phycisphaerae bacterium SM23_30]
MVKKTIIIDNEAYERLQAVRKENESFSQVIKRIVPKPFDLKAFLKELDKHPMSREACEAIADIVESRRKHF